MSFMAGSVHGLFKCFRDSRDVPEQRLDRNAGD
jgi:hypothetical protein